MTVVKYGTILYKVGKNEKDQHILIGIYKNEFHTEEFIEVAEQTDENPTDIAGTYSTNFRIPPFGEATTLKISHETEEQRLERSYMYFKWTNSENKLIFSGTGYCYGRMELSFLDADTTKTDGAKRNYGNILEEEKMKLFKCINTQEDYEVVILHYRSHQ